MFINGTRRWAVAWLALLALWLSGCTSKAQRSPSSITSNSQATTGNPTLIKPGHSIGALQLGGTREQALEFFPKKQNYDQEFTYDGTFTPCVYSEIHWLDPNPLDGRGIFIYMKEGRVFQIQVDSPRYATADGITSGSSPEAVRARYPRTQAYALLYSGAKVNGGRDLIYWVDQQNGIAFELYYDSRVDRRRVGSIIVFELGVEFQPKGCIAPPREWHKLEPYALELPNSEKKTG